MRLADSNIYSFPSAETRRRPESAPRPSTSWEGDSLALSVQVLQEFYYQATRQSRPNRLSHNEAMRFIGRLAEVPLPPVTTKVFRRTMELSGRFGISYWDAAILAAAGGHRVRGGLLRGLERPAGLWQSENHQPLKPTAASLQSTAATVNRRPTSSAGTTRNADTGPIRKMRGGPVVARHHIPPLRPKTKTVQPAYKRSWRSKSENQTARNLPASRTK